MPGGWDNTWDSAVEESGRETPFPTADTSRPYNLTQHDRVGGPPGPRTRGREYPSPRTPGYAASKPLS
jgi:hypothetical protein